MVNQLRLTLGTIFLTIILYGQEISKEQIAKFKVKSIATNFNWGDRKPFILYYNELGDLIKVEVEYKGKFGLTRWFIYDHNLLNEERCYDFKGNEFKYAVYSYDSNNRLIKIERFNPSDGSMERTIKFEYDLQGHKILESRIEGNNINTTEFKYEDDRLIKEIWLTAPDSVSHQTTYLYNKSGRLIKSTDQLSENDSRTTEYFYDIQGRLIKKHDVLYTIYKYSNDGLLVKEIRAPNMKWKYNGDRLLSEKLVGRRYIKEYRYDEHGLIIEENNSGRKTTYKYGF